MKRVSVRKKMMRTIDISRCSAFLARLVFVVSVVGMLALLLLYCVWLIVGVDIEREKQGISGLFRLVCFCFLEIRSRASSEKD